MIPLPFIHNFGYATGCHILYFVVEKEPQLKFELIKVQHNHNVNILINRSTGSEFFWKTLNHKITYVNNKIRMLSTQHLFINLVPENVASLLSYQLLLSDHILKFAVFKPKTNDETTFD